MCVCVCAQPDREVSHQTAFSPKGTCGGLWSDLMTDGRLDSPTGWCMSKLLDLLDLQRCHIHTSVSPPPSQHKAPAHRRLRGKRWQRHWQWAALCWLRAIMPWSSAWLGTCPLSLSALEKGSTSGVSHSKLILLLLLLCVGLQGSY